MPRFPSNRLRQCSYPILCFYIFFTLSCHPRFGVLGLSQPVGIAMGYIVMGRISSELSWNISFFTEVYIIHTSSTLYTVWPAHHWPLPCMTQAAACVPFVLSCLLIPSLHIKQFKRNIKSPLSSATALGPPNSSGSPPLPHQLLEVCLGAAGKALSSREGPMCGKGSIAELKGGEGGDLGLQRGGAGQGPLSFPYSGGQCRRGDDSAHRVSEASSAVGPEVEPGFGAHTPDVRPQVTWPGSRVQIPDQQQPLGDDNQGNLLTCFGAVEERSGVELPKLSLGLLESETLSAEGRHVSCVGTGCCEDGIKRRVHEEAASLPCYEWDKGEEEAENIPLAYGTEEAENIPLAYGTEEAENIPLAYGTCSCTTPAMVCTRTPPWERWD